MSKSWKLRISATLALFLTFSIFLGMTYVVVAANPTVINPDFEIPLPLAWDFNISTPDLTPDFFGSYPTGWPHTGAQSVGIDIVDPEPGDEGFWFQVGVGPVYGDVDYKLSAWVYVAFATPNSYVRIGVLWYDSLGVPIGEVWSTEIYGQQYPDWVPLSVTGTAPAATDSAEIRLKLRVDEPPAGGGVFFDDVEFTVESSATAEKGGNSPPDHGWYLDPEADPYNEMLQINISAVGEPVNVTSFTLQAGGTANDTQDVAEVDLTLDSNSNGLHDLGEEVLANGTYPSDNGSLTLQDSHVIPKGETHSFLIVYQMTGTSDAGETFMFNVTNIAAHGQTSGNPTTIQGLPISSSVKTTVGSLIASEGPETPEDHYWNSTGEPDPYNEMLQLKLEAQAEDFNVTSVTLQAAGTGNDTKDITEVNLILDTNGNGQYDNGENFFSNGTYPADDGLLTLSIDGGYVITKWDSVYFLIAYQMADPVIPGKNFTFNVTAINATGSIDGSQFVVGLPISSCTKTTKDTTLPSIGTPTQEPGPETVMPDQNVTVSVNVTDMESGVREVILSYSIDGGAWTNVTMVKGTGDTYEGEVSGFSAGTQVKYKIIAYDNADNFAVEDNAGEFYVYTVIPEFPTWISMLIMLTLLTVVILIYKRRLLKTPIS